MIESDWIIVIEDMVILFALCELARRFLVGWHIDSLRWIGFGFILVILSVVFVAFGDVLLALEYTAADTWVLERVWRAHVFRVSLAAGFLIMLSMLIFGDFSDERRKARD